MYNIFDGKSDDKKPGRDFIIKKISEYNHSSSFLHIHYSAQPIVRLKRYSMSRFSVYRILRDFQLLFVTRPKKVLFEHIPKCGGTTVSDYLKSQYFNKRIFRINGNNPPESIEHFKSLSEKKRYSYDLVLGHNAHQLRQFTHPEMLKFVIFREPVDRIISHYYFVLRSPDHYLYKTVTDKRMSLFDYATSNISWEIRNYYVCSILQISADKAEENAETSIRHAYDIIREDYDIVGILKDLNSTMNTLAQEASFSKQFKPKILNENVDRPKVTRIDEATLKSIAQVNHLDVKLYALIKNYANVNV